MVIRASLCLICFIALVFAVPSAQQFRDAAVFDVVIFCFGSVVIREAAGRVPARSDCHIKGPITRHKGGLPTPAGTLRKAGFQGSGFRSTYRGDRISPLAGFESAGHFEGGVVPLRSGRSFDPRIAAKASRTRSVI